MVRQYDCIPFFILSTLVCVFDIHYNFLLPVEFTELHHFDIVSFLLLRRFLPSKFHVQI